LKKTACALNLKNERMQRKDFMGHSHPRLQLTEKNNSIVVFASNINQKRAEIICCTIFDF
jgi:hypothetical protein